MSNDSFTFTQNISYNKPNFQLVYYIGYLSMIEVDLPHNVNQFLVRHKVVFRLFISYYKHTEFFYQGRLHVACQYDAKLRRETFYQAEPPLSWSPPPPKNKQKL